MKPLDKATIKRIDRLSVDRRALRAIHVLPSCVEAQKPEEKLARWHDNNPLEPGERFAAWKFFSGVQL